MPENEGGAFYNLQTLLNQDYRGVNIAVYALATASLAFSIHKIRPVSKFSKASKVPDHFIKNHEPLKGVYTGVQHSPVRLLINHRAPIYLPLWHSSKPPIPVKLWGVDIVSGNAVNWLECVAKGQKVTLKPIGRDKEDLISTVLLHLPQAGLNTILAYPSSDEARMVFKLADICLKTKTVETLDIGQKLVELGFAQASVPQPIKKKTLESQLAPVIITAESSAKKYRNGVWSDKLPPIPFYVTYWRKGSKMTVNALIVTANKFVQFLTFALKSILIGTKNLALRPFRTPTKSIQAT